jgi:hypothetical protein
VYIFVCRNTAWVGFMAGRSSVNVSPPQLKAKLSLAAPSAAGELSPCTPLFSPLLLFPPSLISYSLLHVHPTGCRSLPLLSPPSLYLSLLNPLALPPSLPDSTCPPPTRSSSSFNPPPFTQTFTHPGISERAERRPGSQG